jgi:cobalt/nickel transport protein
MSTRRFFAVFLLAALLVAGVASYYASAHPDGLEHVAGKTGFLDSADESRTSDSPLAGYSTRGVDDERLSVGISGVVGAVSVLVLAGGLFWVLRRREDA